jgi:subtilase family serine protease
VLNPFAHHSRTDSRRRWARLSVETLEGRQLLSAGAPLVQPMLSVEPNVLNGQTPYTPAQVANAYGFDQISFAGSGGQSIKGDGTGQTIAIVEMYDDPAIASDLHVFDQHFGLPDPKFIKATPDGLPGVNSLWSMETALDVEWAHAMAPKATILLVEARGSTTSLLSAVNYARNYSRVSVVSMSWAEPEFSSESAYDSYFTTPAGHSPVSFVASSGDYGSSQGPYWPAVSPNVLGVGGTTLNLTSAGNYSSEAGWSGSTGGYSGYHLKYKSYVAEPSFQETVQHSGYRTSPDVSYDANQSTGYWIYDSVGSYGWIGVGGTSAGAPQWAALVAIADQGRALAGKSALPNVQADVYTLPSTDFHDVTRGSNGYSAHAGYDLVTGLGTPIANLVVRDLGAAQAPASNHGGTTTTTGVVVNVNIPIYALVAVGDEQGAVTMAAFTALPQGPTFPLASLAATAEEQTPAAIDAGDWERTIEASLENRYDGPGLGEFKEADLPGVDCHSMTESALAAVFTDDAI